MQLGEAISTKWVVTLTSLLLRMLENSFCQFLRRHRNLKLTRLLTVNLWTISVDQEKVEHSRHGAERELASSRNSPSA